MAQYRTGTVTVTSNSSTITGSGTAWLAAGIEAGHWFNIRGQGVNYTVAAVLSDTQLVLTGAYQGATEAGLFYILHTDFTPRGYAVPGPGDVDATLIIRRSIYEIDADLTSSLGAPGTGNGQVRVADILDLNSSTALAGQVFTKLASGGYGFTTPGALSVTLANLATASADTGLIYAGASGTGVQQFRGLQVIGASLASNADRLTITVPPAGEVNTLTSVGSAQSVSLVAPKSGTVLNAYGLRAGTGISVVRDGNDVLVTNTSPSSGGGGTTGGEANTAENLGGTGTNVVRVFSDKLGISLRFRSILLNTDHFTVTGETSGQYAVSARRQRLADSPDVDTTAAVAGHILRLESDNIWRTQAMPATGIASLQADPAPRLGGDLVLAGRRIVGLTQTISGMIEKPKAKSYTLILKSNAPIGLTSMAATCATGSVNFEVFLGTEPQGIPDGPGVAPIAGSASSTVTEVIPGDVVSVPTGSRLTLRLTPVGSDVADFSFSIAYSSA